MKKNTRLIGRKTECERLDKCMRDDSAQLVIIYGRRRVGKTYLINEYFDNAFDFKFSGSFGETRENQLKNFANELRRKTKEKTGTPADWIEAFELLRDYLENLVHTGKKVVFFDEMPWADTHKSGFLPAFEYFWNNWASSQHDIVFIACGSATSWMVNNLAKNKGGLFNRQTCKLYLEPFKLHEVEEYLEHRNIYWSRYDIVECYMILGGIPYYLSLLDQKLSYVQNIDYLFFKQNAELENEFDHLYNTLFTNSEKYIKAVQVLAAKKSGFTRSELADKLSVPENGRFTTLLNNLVDSGFVRRSTFYGKKKKETVYQLKDYYTRFYYHFIHNKNGNDAHFWSNAIDLPSRRAWAGYSYEQICKDHIGCIKSKLGISGVLSEESTWFTNANEDLGTSGAQIDLLIDRRDRVINVCEIKYAVEEFVIDKDYESKLRNKVNVFRRFSATKKGIQLIMITTYGVKTNKYSSIVGNQVVLDDLFEKW